MLDPDRIKSIRIHNLDKNIVLFCFIRVVDPDPHWILLSKFVDPNSESAPNSVGSQSGSTTLIFKFESVPVLHNKKRNVSAAIFGLQVRMQLQKSYIHERSRQIFP
jgi:hypothetical protein